MRETDEPIEGPSVGGDEKKNSNPFVFIIRTVLRDAWVREEEEEREAVRRTGWLFLFLSCET